jgi:hypothetical protein
MIMQHFNFYHRETGELSTRGFSTSDKRGIEIAALNAPPEHLPIEGQHDRRTHCVNVSSVTVVARDAPPEPTVEEREQLDAQLVAATAEHHDALTREAHGLIRRLVIDPRDSAARARLVAIDAEISRTA